MTTLVLSVDFDGDHAQSGALHEIADVFATVLRDAHEKNPGAARPMTVTARILGSGPAITVTI